MRCEEMPVRLVRGRASMAETEFTNSFPNAAPVPKEKRVLRPWKHGPDSLKVIQSERWRGRIEQYLLSLGLKSTTKGILQALDGICQTQLSTHMKYLRESGRVQCEPRPMVKKSPARLYWKDK